MPGVHRQLRKRRYRLLFESAALVPLLLAVFSFMYLRRITAELEQTMASMTELEATVQRTDLIVRLMLDVESGHRGFVVTGNEEFLQTHVSAAAQLPLLLAEMNALPVSSDSTRMLRGALAQAVREKLAESEGVIATARAAGREEAARRVGQKRGKVLMDDVRQRAAELNAAEIEQLGQRRVGLGKSLQRQRWLATGLIVTLAVLVILVGWLMWEGARARALARMCAWSRTVEYEGEWLSFEEYLLRRFDVDTTHGISPSEAAKARAQLQAAQAAEEMPAALPAR